ncbi:MAG: hypothetical protein IJR47_02300 [Clostridia bacterium]|nr:hypothetical protein [Clostridia bacterium]
MYRLKNFSVKTASTCELIFFEGFFVLFGEGRLGACQDEKDIKSAEKTRSQAAEFNFPMLKESENKQSPNDFVALVAKAVGLATGWRLRCFPF